jgi:Tol biopolymer transport system component
MMRRTLHIGVACFAALLGSHLVGCDPPTEPFMGTIQVNSSTSGQPIDQNGYTIGVDQAEGRPIAANGTLTISDLSGGFHKVQIADIASNCSLDGPSSRTVSVTGDGPAQVTFAVECRAPTGGIEITTSTNGESPDSNGYSIALDGGVARPVPSAGTVILAGLTAGSHDLHLFGIEPNCSVVGDNPRTLAVSTDTIRTTFDIGCAPPTGSIVITTTTNGIFPDADGYVFSLDGGSGQPVDDKRSATIPGLTVGTHTIQLAGVASNCAVAGENPWTITVLNGSTASASFLVTCLGTGTSTLLFASDRTGLSHMYRVQDDGSSLLDLTPALEAYDGDWSPDGTRIVLNTAAGIQIRNANGSNPVSLAVYGETPKWSPDGSTIVFEAADTVRLMSADGSLGQRLTRGLRPDWSPDGTQILFDRIDDHVCFVFDCFPVFGLYVMKADGSQVQRVASVAQCGAWSPDGRSIAYVATFDGVYIMNADGTGKRRITDGSCPIIWSPDGSAIAEAVGQSNGTSEMAVSPMSGGQGTILASSSGNEFPESWK